MNRWRLTRRAEASLEDIARWTLKTFGAAQAARYENDLIAKCRAVASGRALTRSCREAFGIDVRQELRVARSGRHLIIFAEIDGVVVIQDFLHDARDLPTHLRGRE